MKKLMLVIAMVAMFAGSAVAADWDFYGSARIGTWWSDQDVIDTAGDDAKLYDQYLHSNARIGAKVKVSDELSGRFEYGAGGGNANIRLLYGEWNFGSGSLVVGQAYTPMNMFYSDQVFDGDGDLLPYGGVYSGRAGQLKLKFGGFQIALVPVDTATDGAAATETKLPGLELAYSLNMDAISMKFAGGYQTFDATAAGVDDSVDTWILAAGGKAAFGAFYVAGNIYVGQNAGNMITIGTNGTWNQQGLAHVGATNVYDNDAFGALLVAGFTVNEMFNIEAGYGYAATELDVTNADKDKVQSYYLNTTINMAPGVFVVPEIGVIDGEEAGDLETTYFGMKWQINF